MTEPTHGDIHRAIGNLEGRLEGIHKGITDNAKRAAGVEAKISELHDRVGKVELWRAEMRGMGLGMKAGVLLTTGAIGGGLVKAAEWAVGKLS